MNECLPVVKVNGNHQFRNNFIAFLGINIRDKKMMQSNLHFTGPKKHRSRKLFRNVQNKEMHKKMKWKL